MSNYNTDIEDAGFDSPTSDWERSILAAGEQAKDQIVENYAQEAAVIDQDVVAVSNQVRDLRAGTLALRRRTQAVRLTFAQRRADAAARKARKAEDKDYKERLAARQERKNMKEQPALELETEWDSDASLPQPDSAQRCMHALGVAAQQSASPSNRPASPGPSSAKPTYDRPIGPRPTYNIQMSNIRREQGDAAVNYRRGGGAFALIEAEFAQVMGGAKGDSHKRRR